MIWAVSLSTTDLITRSLTPVYRYLEFVVYLDSVTPDGPLVQTELYLHYPLHEASPKAISERTSYLQVRLEFHRYPQLIPQFLTYVGSALQRVLPRLQPGHGRSLGFGSTSPNFSPSSDSLSLRLRLF